MRSVFPGKARVAMSAQRQSSDSTRYSGKSPQVLAAAAMDLAECGHSRAQVAFTMSAVLGYVVSVTQIEAIVAQSKPHRMPAEWIPAWVKATGSRRLLDMICEDSGLSVATAEDRQFAEAGRHLLALQKITPGLWEKI